MTAVNSGFTGHHQSADRMREIGAKSAEIRRTRRALRADLKALPAVEAMALVADVISDCRPEFEGMRVDDLLLMLGKPKAVRCLTVVHVAPFRTVGELTERQRGVLCDLLRGWESDTDGYASRFD